MKFAWEPIDNHDPRYNQEAKTPVGKLVVKQRRSNTPTFLAKVNRVTIGWDYRSVTEAKKAAEQAASELAVHAGVSA